MDLKFTGYLLISLIFSCQDGPKVDDKDFFAPAVVHARFQQACTKCHESNRLPPSTGIPHGFGRDCGECHKSVDDPKGISRPWEPLPYNHPIGLKECIGCHGLDRPPRDTHPKEGECAKCHIYRPQTWLPPVFSIH